MSLIVPAFVSIITFPELGTLNLYQTSPLLVPSHVTFGTLEFVAPTFVPDVKEQLVLTVKVGVPASHGLSFEGAVTLSLPPVTMLEFGHLGSYDASLAAV